MTEPQEPSRTRVFDLIASSRSEDAGYLAAADMAALAADRDLEYRLRATG